MHVVADTQGLLADGIVSPEAALEMEVRSRALMVNLAINSVLCTGILFATFGLIFWLADAFAVAVTGIALLGGGLFALARAPQLYAMFGNAAALIGSGMLIGGAGMELMDKYEDIAGWAMLAGGVPVALIAGRALRFGGLTARFVAGSILLMGMALHLTGLGVLADDYDIAGLGRAALLLYTTVAIAAAGWLTDVRLVTALAIVPFAQMLDTGTSYFHAAYVCYSPESTLTILQMGVLIALMVWAAARFEEREARHVRIVAIMAFVVANLAALVGSHWGDVVGQSVWGPGHWYSRTEFENYEAYRTAKTAFKESALVISDELYSILCAVALVALIFWSAHSNRRGLFNASLTFAAIHAYTQGFESFGEEPLAYIIGGFAAIPLAWGAWQWNQRLLGQAATRA